ncbi:MAG: PDZ domain-containing protein [Planctomycetota bacterium]|nr:PDZ domain-containing protein [Planctomycetota bacterium]
MFNRLTANDFRHDSAARLRAAIFMVAVVVIAPTLRADDKVEPKQSVDDAAEITQLISQLNADEYKTRKAATQRLRELGAAAIPALEQAASGKDLEVMIRAIGVLRSHYPRDSADTTEAASDALERLAMSDALSVRSRAAKILDSYSDVRRKRAVAKIEQLGGSIKYLGETQGIITQSSMIHFVFLGADWKGGIQGLKYIKRLSGLRQLYFTENFELTMEQVADLQATLPGLETQRRSEAYLGISGSEDLDGMRPGCFVQTVQPGQPADLAKLRTRDLIVKFGKYDISTFRNPTDAKSLIRVIEEFEPDDKVKVEFIRDGIRRETEITLGRWFPKSDTTKPPKP